MTTVSSNTSIVRTLTDAIEATQNAERAAFDAWANATYNAPYDHKKVMRLTCAHNAAYNAYMKAVQAYDDYRRGRSILTCCACRRPSDALAPIPADILEAVEEHEGWDNLDEGDCGGYCPACLNEWQTKHGTDAPHAIDESYSVSFALDAFKASLTVTVTVSMQETPVTPSVQRAAFDSSIIKSAAYRPDVCTLDIELVTGRSYRYADVPVWTFEGLKDAVSAGRYYNAKIKGVYACEDITA